ncbi:class I SAM-dependent methyltransferase [Luteolibacter luteus]|uniref:Methyltransferase domain-containing protein n=1 Tax=Luteolibacter luteus TaxID=2728835 RepID=A0A858RDY3_9BACT|nr:methyltransferase domain-containing protein [Luteolibacter luteus]QJE94942.1 methyltransferase domain-containing protein [Luteolibacter luteus]
MHRTGDPLQEQLDYYNARAGEYDQWWLRQGRYDRGPELNGRWVAEGVEISEMLARFRPEGEVLEIACGTGIWTVQLLPFATCLTALDGAREVLAVNAAKLKSEKVRYIEADVFKWQPDRMFDVVFFSFWLSHVPPERFEEFWELVRSCLAPGGRVFFVDSLRDSGSTAVNHDLPGEESTVSRRKLNDGREYQVYKVFYEPEDLAARLRALGWEFEVSQTASYFIRGQGSRIP